MENIVNNIVVMDLDGQILAIYPHTRDGRDAAIEQAFAFCGGPVPSTGRNNGTMFKNEKYEIGACFVKNLKAGQYL
jgi:hypothetical protein